MLLNEIFKRVLSLELNQDLTNFKLVINSQEINQNTLWLAIKTPNRHALDYWNESLKPALILYEPPYENPPPQAIAVECLTENLGNIASLSFSESTKIMRVFGITGTDGKSSLV